MRASLIYGTVSLLILLGGCKGDMPATTDPGGSNAQTSPEPPADPAQTPTGGGGPAVPDEGPRAALVPPAPGEPGGLPDDRAPLNEGRIDPASAEGAGQVLQQLGIAIEQRRYTDAAALFRDVGTGSGLQPEQLFGLYRRASDVRVLIGRPGPAEGAAGSLFVEVPVQIYGRLKDRAKPFNLRGPVTLRRVSGVDGATADQKIWHISGSRLKLLGVVHEAPQPPN